MSSADSATGRSPEDDDPLVLTRGLLKAIKKGSVNRCQELLERKANVNICSESFQKPSALMIAAQKGGTEMCRVLLRFGAGVNDRDRFGDTALSLAAANGYVETCALLISSGANVSSRNTAIWIGRPPCTPLVAAAGSGHMDVCKLLVHHRADVNEKDDSGITALGRAALNGRVEVCRFLVAHGADVHARFFAGMTALLWAAKNGYTPIVEYLLSHGSSVNEVADNGQTALMLASAWGRRQTCQFLLDTAPAIYCGARNTSGKTAVELCFVDQDVHMEEKHAMIEILKDALTTERKDMWELYVPNARAAVITDGILDFSVPKRRAEHQEARKDLVLTAEARVVLRAKEVFDLQLMKANTRRASKVLAAYSFDYDKLTFAEGVLAKKCVAEEKMPDEEWLAMKKKEATGALPVPASPPPFSSSSSSSFVSSPPSSSSPTSSSALLL